MYDLTLRNQKIINAIIKKCSLISPNALQLIGIYGSFSSDDIHDKSDLDLLIIATPDAAEKLSVAFVQQDIEVGHDIYCTTWEWLEEDAEFNHPNIAKLMDAKIVYCPDEKNLKKLADIRKKAANIIAAPFSYDDYQKALYFRKEAEHCYAEMLAEDELPKIREKLGGILYFLQNAVAMLNKTYFKKGVKRAYEEFSAMPHLPDKFCELIEQVISSDSAEEIFSLISVLMKNTIYLFKKVFDQIPKVEKEPDPRKLWGTYEEMFSNFRNKFHYAAETGNTYLFYMTMVSMQAMLDEIIEENNISHYSLHSFYDPKNLSKTAMIFDDIFSQYLSECKTYGVKTEIYPTVDDFVEKYLNAEKN